MRKLGIPHLLSSKHGPERDLCMAMIASRTRRTAPVSDSLHAGYSVGMMNTFQFIGLVGGAGAPKRRE